MLVEFIEQGCGQLGSLFGEIAGFSLRGIVIVELEMTVSVSDQPVVRGAYRSGRSSIGNGELAIGRGFPEMRHEGLSVEVLRRGKVRQFAKRGEDVECFDHGIRCLSGLFHLGVMDHQWGAK